jgi:cysteine desulfurase
MEEMESEMKRLSGMRDYLRKKLFDNIPEIYENGDPNSKLPHSLNVSFTFVEGESLLMGIDDVAVSSGSACTSASLEPSYVLKSLGASDELAHSSIRFGLGRFNTQEEVDYVADKLIKVVARLREMSPLWEMHNEGIDLSKVEWAHH